MDKPRSKLKTMAAVAPELAARSWFLPIAARSPDSPPAPQAAMAESLGLRIHQELRSLEIGMAQEQAVAVA
jgi:hypothetical protein